MRKRCVCRHRKLSEFDSFRPSVDDRRWYCHFCGRRVALPRSHSWRRRWRAWLAREDAA